MEANFSRNYRIINIDNDNIYEIKNYNFNFYSYDIINNYLKEGYKFEIVIFLKTNEVVHFSILNK